MSVLAHILDPVSEVDQVVRGAIPFSEFRRNNYEFLRKAIGGARIVLMGEQTHGTEEFYQIRAEMSKALIEHEGFSAVLGEADFPAFYEVNRFVRGTHSVQKVKGKSHHADPHETVESAMEKLKARFPIWMWHNRVFKDLILWIKAFNEHCRRDERPPVNVIGLDIYSMFESAEQVVNYLDLVDSKLADVAREQYGTLGTFRPEAADYCRAFYQGKISSQAPQVSAILASLNNMRMEYSQAEGNGDEFFNAIENARIVAAAEEYYRKSYMGGNITWNIRDNAMVKMIEHSIQRQQEVFTQMGITDRQPRSIVWAHNSHVGDAAYTEQHERRQWNVGRLVRAKGAEDVAFIIGFSTHSGTVRAARQWNGRDLIMDLTESLPDSTSHLLHRVSAALPEPNFALITRTNAADGLTDAQKDAIHVLDVKRLERFVGVQYVKKTERQSHYSFCNIGKQFDLIIHLDKTSAVKTIPKSRKSRRPGTIDYGRFENFEESTGSDLDEIIR